MLFNQWNIFVYEMSSQWKEKKGACVHHIKYRYWNEMILLSMKGLIYDILIHAMSYLEIVIYKMSCYEMSQHRFLTLKFLEVPVEKSPKIFSYRSLQGSRMKWTLGAGRGYHQEDVDGHDHLSTTPEYSLVSQAALFQVRCSAVLQRKYHAIEIVKNQQSFRLKKKKHFWLTKATFE